MVMRTSILAVPVAAFLAACTTLGEQAAQAEREIDQMVQIYGSACEKLGFQRNTDPWRNCVIGLSQRDAARYSSNAYYYGSPYWHHYPYWAY
jgi:hypothetical protein